MIERLQHFNSAARQWGLALLFPVSLIILSLLVFALLTTSTDDVYIIDDFFVSEGSNALVSGSFLSEAIYNEIRSITKKAVSEKIGVLSGGYSDTEMDVSFEYQGIKVSGLSRMLDSLRSRKVSHITGLVFRQANNLKMLVSIEGEESITVVVREDQIESAISKAAERILEKTDPYMLARRLTLKDGSDEFYIRKLLSIVLTNESKSDDFWAWNLSGNMLVEKRKYARALEEYRKATRSIDGSGDIRSRISRANEAGALINLGRYDSAARVLRGPDVFQYYNAHFMMGFMHYRQGEYIDAERYLRTARNMNPYDPDVSNLLGRALIEGDDYSAALEHLLAAYHIYYESGRYLEADRTRRVAG
jgi:hypothetical protein